MINKEAWLEGVAITCSSTLSSLNKKAEANKHISDEDQMLSEVCMGYLYLLHIAQQEGVLTEDTLLGKTLKRTIH
jgi:hypothetical protein|tara:strand:- start:885 stop:1109 length:225 start_codon:yes stop_codon:yes gene_type:complete